MKKDFLQPEDYAEPRCLLCDEPYGVTPKVKAVPQRRILEKMNDYMSRRDYAGAERHLKYWLEEAKLGHDKGGELLIQNELIGHYRKTGNRDAAFKSADEALRLVRELEMEDTVSAGTTFVNAATAFHAFGESDRAVPLFEKAKTIFEATGASPEKRGGLYNNMALALVALKQFDAALALYEDALRIMEDVPGGALEQAITCLNMADAKQAQLGAEEAEQAVFPLVDRAFELLNTPDLPRDGYYAFVCEKCAPSFSYYGYFLAANALKQRAEEIYERA